MCRLVVQACQAGNEAVIADARRIAGEAPDSEWLPATPQEFCGRILHTCYMGTTNSSPETRNRAKNLSKAIGSYHIDLNMDSVVTAISTLFTFVTNFTPRFTVHGGSPTENLALQSSVSLTRLVPLLISWQTSRHDLASWSVTCSLSFFLWCVKDRVGGLFSFWHQVRRLSEQIAPQFTDPSGNLSEQ
jgi:NAD+ synthase (glutamine-hydrolysing)